MENTLQEQTFIGRIRHQGWWLLAAGVLLLSLFIAGRALWPADRQPARLVVYAFSAEEEVFTQGIFPAFEQTWEAETGADLTIEGVFGPSGTLAGQIHLGAPADVAVLSNLNQVNWLQLGKMIDSDTQAVVIGASPIVIVTRPGNPYNLETLADLSAPGISLLHADPRCSGMAEWALLAEYGAALQTTGEARAAEAQLAAIWQNVRVLAPSARALLTLFELGLGDAFLTYEQDARLAQARGVPLEIVMPAKTIVAQPVAIVIDRNVKSSEQAVVQAFIDFLKGEQGQQIFSQFYLRPAGMELAAPTAQAEFFTAQDLGGWSQVYTLVVEPFWEAEIETNLELESIPAYFKSER
jgi:sulfate/thiosulfate transport system substrate-binding protein